MCGVLTACRCDTTSKYIVSTIPLDIPIWGHLTHGITLFQLMTEEENEICVIRIAQLIKGYVLFLFCLCLLNGDVTKIEWLLNHYRLWHQDVIVNRCRIDSDTRTLSWTYVDHYIPHTAFKHTHNWFNAIFSVSKRVCIGFLRKIVKKQ